MIEAMQQHAVNYKARNSMKWLKYTIISGISAYTGSTIVNLLGSTYVVGNKFVRKIK